MVVPQQKSILSTIFRIILFPFLMLALCVLAILGLTLCFLIYALCIVFFFLIIASVAGIVFSVIKEQYVFTALCTISCIFSIVVSHFYWQNFSDINEIVKSGIRSYMVFGEKIVVFLFI